MGKLQYDIRYSRESDIPQLKELLYNAFGNMVVEEGGYNNIENGRYLIAVTQDGNIIACTGFCHSREYAGIQLTWTATDPICRKQGIMTNLVGHLIASTDQDIYCCCWRVMNRPNPNLHSVLTSLGFIEIIHDMCKYSKEHKCLSHETCPYWEECSTCAQDLYLLKRS